MWKDEQERWEVVLQVTSEKPESTIRHSSVGVQPLSMANEASLHHQPHWSLHLPFLLTRKPICPACSHPLHLAHLHSPFRAQWRHHLLPGSLL